MPQQSHRSRKRLATGRQMMPSKSIVNVLQTKNFIKELPNDYSNPDTRAAE
jgi:hypothetical protein